MAAFMEGPCHHERIKTMWWGHVMVAGPCQRRRAGAWPCTVSSAGVEKETHRRGEGGEGGDFGEMKEENLRPSLPRDPDQHHRHLGAWETFAASSRTFCWSQICDQLGYVPPDVCSPSFPASLAMSLHFCSTGSTVTCKVLACMLLLQALFPWGSRIRKCFVISEFEIFKKACNSNLRIITSDLNHFSSKAESNLKFNMRWLRVCRNLSIYH